jgi:hypothetical protein
MLEANFGELCKAEVQRLRIRYTRSSQKAPSTSFGE